VSSFFDPEAEFEVHRRNLPHRIQPAVIYFVTYHLADSLPAKKLAEFKAERKRWLEVNPPPHREDQIQEYRRNFFPANSEMARRRLRLLHPGASGDLPNG
jgi:putative transposase